MSKETRIDTWLTQVKEDGPNTTQLIAVVESQPAANGNMAIGSACDLSQKGKS